MVQLCRTTQLIDIALKSPLPGLLFLSLLLRLHHWWEGLSCEARNQEFNQVRNKKCPLIQKPYQSQAF